MNANATDAVFPLIFTGDPNVQCYGAGLNKRELFAAMAMQGLLSNSEVHKAGGYTRNGLLAEAVMNADALIATLNEPQGD